MNWADYVIIAVLLLSVLMGLWRGLIAEVLALAVWVAAVWLAWVFGPRVAVAFRGSIQEPSIRIILGFVICFVVVLIAGALIKFVMDKLVKGTGLTGSDRLLGMLFGLARGALLVTLAVFLLGFTPFTRDPWWHQSQLLPTFTSAAGWLGRQLPQGVQHYLHPSNPEAQAGHPLAATAISGKLSAVSAGMTRVLDPQRPARAATTSPKAVAGVAAPAHSRDN
ncbi:MAG TPA: CvpA family protein [Rhodanobacteraceae bacterium]